MMTVTMYKHHLDTTPYSKMVNWLEFVHSDEIAKHSFAYPSKEQVPAVSPAEMQPGTTRADRNAKGVWFCMFDVDKVSQETMVEIREHLCSLGLSFRLFTTWSHAKHFKEHGLCSFRVVIQTSRMLLPSEWSSAWSAMNERLVLGYADSRASDISRLFFLPSAPAGTDPNDVINVFFDGQAFDVDSLGRS